MNYSTIDNYLLYAIICVTAANSVAGASNANKKAAVLSAVIAASSAVAVVAAGADPKVAEVSVLIDLTASVINALSTPAVAVPPALPAAA